jgi:ABC-type branched-subunit amino acid transport system ATPase component
MDPPDPRAPLLQVRGLSKDFGGLHALQAVDLDVEAGEIVGIIGPNGSGKTTFFNVLSGIHPARLGLPSMSTSPVCRRTA